MEHHLPEAGQGSVETLPQPSKLRLVSSMLSKTLQSVPGMILVSGSRAMADIFDVKRGPIHAHA